MREASWKGERAFHQKNERALWLSGHVKRESLFPSLRLSGGAHSSRPASQAPLLPATLLSHFVLLHVLFSALPPASRSSCLLSLSHFYSDTCCSFLSGLDESESI